MSSRLASWSPVLLLVSGGLGLIAVGQQQRPGLEAPLDTALPAQIDGLQGRDEVVSVEEARVAGFTDYAFRVYGDTEHAEAGGAFPSRWASIYLGFYESQTDGRTIHSPRNCLPGAGWEAISSTTAAIRAPGNGQVTVNRYVLQNGDDRALVLYWYQGRGRVAHNEYLVKWDLLRDAALKRRTDEALVRIVVPIVTSEDEAFQFAAEIASRLVGDVARVLPGA